VWTIVSCVSTVLQGVVAIIKYADIQGTTVIIDGRLDRFYQTVIKDSTSHDLLNTWLETDADMLVEIHKLLGTALTATRTTTPVATSPHNTRSRGTTPTLETPSTSK
jgi:hypothetical protein